MEYDKHSEREEATEKVLSILEEWAKIPRFIWFRKLQRISEIEKGLLRNVINDLKKSREIVEIHGDNKRKLFCLKKHLKKCQEEENRFRGKETIAKDGSKTRIILGKTKASERTRKRLEKQSRKRQVKARAKKKNKSGRVA